MSGPRIALVHERFTEYGGSEAVVGELRRIWPDATVFAPIVHAGADPGIDPVLPWDTISDTALSRISALLGHRSHAPLLPCVPAALRGLPLADFDAVLVSHHAFATQAAFAATGPVFAYVHSPARWAWDREFRAHEGGGALGRAALIGLSGLARRGELRAAPRLAQIIANSRAVAERVEQWWGRPATVIHPPVRVDRFTVDPGVAREDFFLVAGRLVPYKRADLAIRAARRAGARLIITGAGRFRSQLAALAGPETTFLGAVPEPVLQDMYRRCRALIMPGVEDFGIVPVEAMACGAPVIAVGAGGALDTVEPGITGLHVEFGSDTAIVDQLAETVRTFDPARFDTARIRGHAESFGPAAFRTRIADTVAAHLGHTGPGHPR